MSGKKVFEDFGAKQSSVEVTGEIRANLQVIFEALDRFVMIIVFSSVDDANALRFFIWCLVKISLSHGKDF